MITDTLMYDTLVAVLQQTPVDAVPLSNILPQRAGLDRKSVV